MSWKHYPIIPVGKPRMTQRDRWKKRPCVLRYHQFKDQCRLHNVTLGDSVSVRFYIPMPDSWSKKKKREMLNQPHQQKADIDNLLKALLDACLADDSSVYAITATKHWDVEGGFELWQG